MVIIRFDFKSLRDEIRNSLLLFKPKAKENVKAIFLDLVGADLREF